MKRTQWIMMILALAACCLSGCTPGEGEDPLAALDGAFCCRISGSFCGEQANADIWAEALPEADGEPVRAVKMTFTAPESLRGISVTAENFRPETHEVSEVTVSLDGTVIDSSALSGFLTPALLLAARFEPLSVTTEKQGDRSVTLLSAAKQGNTRKVGVCDGKIVTLEGTFGGTWGKWEIDDLSFAQPTS